MIHYLLKKSLLIVFLLPLFAFCNTTSYSIYLAGKVRKDKEITDMQDWRSFYAENLKRKDIKLFTPENSLEDTNDTDSIFGLDCYLIKKADLILVNGSTKLGLGTAQEILIAKYFKKPVLIVIPPNSHNRRDLVMHGIKYQDWIHPFLVASTDQIVISHEKALDVLENIEALLSTRL